MKRILLAVVAAAALATSFAPVAGASHNNNGCLGVYYQARLVGEGWHAIEVVPAAACD
jgi:hypothetical protein